MARGRKPKDLSKTFLGLYEQFLNFKQAEGMRERTIKDYKTTLQDFGKFYPVETVFNPVKVKESLLEYFKTKADKQPATYNRPYSNLHAFFEWCVRNGYIPANPLKELGLKKKRDDGDTVRHLDSDKVTRFLEAIDIKSYAGLRDYALVLLTLDTGIRPKEALSLTIDDVDFDAMTVTVRKQYSKTKKERTLPISNITAQALIRLIEQTPEEWGNFIFYSLNGTPMTSEMWTKRLLDHYQKKLGFRVTPYMLRHTFAITFLRNGGHQFALKYEMGHSTMNMTQRYVQLAAQDIKEQHKIASPVAAFVKKKLRSKITLKRGPRNQL